MLQTWSRIIAKRKENRSREFLFLRSFRFILFDVFFFFFLIFASLEKGDGSRLANMGKTGSNMLMCQRHPRLVRPLPFRFFYRLDAATISRRGHI